MRKTIISLNGLEIRDYETRPVNNLKIQLSKGFNPNKSGDTEKLHTLITYLYALGQRALIAELLEQIYDYAKYDANKIYLWHYYGSFLIFLAELESLEGNEEQRAHYLAPVLKDDIFGGTASRLEHYLEFSSTSYQDDAVVASFETQRYQCELMSGHISELLYYKHMLCEEDRTPDIEAETTLMLENSVKYLNLFLRKKTPYKPIDFFDGLPDRIRTAGYNSVSRYEKALQLIN